MKNLIIALSTAAIFSMSAAVMAGGDKQEVTVTGSGILQEQWGMGDQDAVIGLVSNDFDGKATIVVRYSHITQTQRKNGTQTAKIGVVGCDCGGGHGKGKR